MLTSFGLRFIISNITISFLVIGLLLVKRGFKNHITIRFQYNLWLLFLLLLAIPFIPVKPSETLSLHSVLSFLDSFGANPANTALQTDTAVTVTDNAKWFQDFYVSAKQKSPALLTICLLGLWLAGAFLMVFRTLHSNLKIRQLVNSSLPVQSEGVKALLKECLETSGIDKNITVLSSAYINSPISVGLFHPRIILPIPVISDFNKQEIRYILLHELQHFKHKDLPVNYAMCLAGILYWFHPFVWLGLKEMRNDRELACDASVLNLLEEDNYYDYGNALILFAGKLSNPSFPFAAGIGGTTKQITKRIQNIAAFSPESKWLKLKSKFIFVITFVMILTSIPFLSVIAASDNRYQFSSSKAAYEDLSPYFDGNDGSFVLYNQSTGSWSIYNKANSVKRISPDSTYKIYSALFGLERGSITPEATILPWNKEENLYDSWNRDQNLDSAMANSVNWYFQALDQKTGMKDLKKYMKLTGYGNEDLSGGLSSYWMESSLKISPVEQVELLTKFYQNDFQFKDSSINAVKNSLLITKNNAASLYGKTGSGRIEEKDVNGWFIGFVEKSDTTYFFAANIQGKDNVNGSLARNIALNILKEKNIFTTN